MTTIDLGAIIRQDIAANGPMSIAKFMSYALNNLKDSYYQTQNPIGKMGDFITAPEISQLFGEIIGIWCANYWHIENKPSRVKLIELGPGKGTLMSDLLRATKNIPGFHDAIEICLVEINQQLKQEQQKRINHKNTQWFDQYNDIPQDCFSIIIANEFFDALPIEQYIKRDEMWYINMVDLKDGIEQLCVTKHLIEDNIKEFLTTKYHHVPEGGIVELNDETTITIKNIVSNLNKNGGIMLVIDYGYTEQHNRSFISTLQSIKNHTFNPLFDNIGLADITAHVNFSTLIETANLYGATTYGPISQRKFLQNMQIDLRKEKLLANASPKEKESILSGYNRLIHIDQMGELFKVIAISNKTITDYIGF